MRLELATTYGPQISEELLAIRIGKDIQLSLETLVFAADSEIPEASNSSGTSCFFLLTELGCRSPNLKDRSKDSLDRSLRLELATTYGPQISEELLAIRIGKDIQLSSKPWSLLRIRKSEASNSSGTSCSSAHRHLGQPNPQGSIQGLLIDPEVGTGNHLRTPDL